MSTVVVIGQGYVGLPMALRATQVGHRVTGLELNKTVVENLNQGVSHIGDISDIELADALQNGYSASADPSCIGKADVVVVCVPTPLSASGGPDLGAVEGAADTISRHVARDTLCILESTTYPGTTEEIFGPIVAGEKLVIGSDLFVAFSPERIDPGNKQYGVKNTPKVVGGITDACTARARDFYETFIDTVVPAKRAREAEMAKLLENTFRHVNIALVNEMVRFSRELDIDLGNAIDAAATKPFGFMAFRPGPGVGGHCIPVDPSYLSHRVKAKLGYAFRMVELAEEINQAAPGYVANRIRDILNDDSKAVRGARILLLGVAYKANIADQRESPADPLAVRLSAWGATVRYHDPYVARWSPRGMDETFECVADVDQEMRDSDLVVLMQAHEQYDRESLGDADVHVLDTRGVIDGKRVHGL